MIREYSAGGIVFRKSEIGNRKSEIWWLVCRHSQHKGWVFPKGFIGDKIKGETKEKTAVREVKEETGVRGKIVAALSEVSYFYHWKDGRHYKKVYYFLMEYKGGDITKHDHEMSDVEWWDREKVMKDLTYKADKKAFREALVHFKGIGNQ